VRSISRTAGKMGIECVVENHYGASESALADRLLALSGDPAVHGIICQTPLPNGMTLESLGTYIAPAKDVDGANFASLGGVAAGLDSFAPATAAAVLEILSHEKIELSGARAVVVGRSNVVGKPAALLLLAQNATVTVCHSRTTGLEAVCATADILVAAVGRPELLNAGHIKQGAVVIDVGTNPTADGALVGDVDADSARSKASALTPVPGGVGPVTSMLLMRNTIRAARKSGSAPQ
jgi:methylenetetrahydrofolate dehydrogenase (NADP+)/methenyltetrahydrofolate cyclohydrolase